MKYRSINCLIYFFLFAGTSVFATNFKSDLVAYYPFDGNASDMSGNGNNGTVYGASLGTDRHGQADMAYQFDGINDWIDVGGPSSLTNGENQTISVWVKGVGDGPAYWNDDTQAGGDMKLILLDDQKVRFGVHSHNSRTSSFNFSSEDSLDPTEWAQLVVTISNGLDYKLYVNGIISSTYTDADSIKHDNRTDISIGGATHGNHGFFNGSIDEVRHYVRTLSDTEVKALYELEKPKEINLSLGLVAYYPFDGNASDMSGNGNHGTVYGATLREDRHGKAGKAYGFDGTNDWIGLSQQIPDLVNFTLSVWFNGTGSIFQDETESSGNDFGIYYHGTDGTFRIRNTKGGSPFNESYSPSLFLNNSWNNVIFSLSSNKVIVAFNGNKREYVGTYTGNVGYHASTPRIGAYNYFGNSNFFNGSIDEIRLYRRAITSDEVTALYELGKPLIEQNVSQSRAENVGQGDPMTDYDKSKTYSLGALVLVGQNSYIATRAVPVNTNPLSAEYWTNLSVAATALKVPVETVANLSTSTILNSLPNSAPKDYSYLSRSTERREYKKTATIEIYSPLIDYSALFDGDDVEIIDYQVSDLGLSSGKVRVNGAMRTQGVYTTFNGEFNSFTTDQDNNGNGIADYYEKNMYYEIKMSGTASYSMQGYGDFSANLSADVYKNTGQFRFNLDETVTIQSSNIDGLNPGYTESLSLSITPIHATGTITYDPKNSTYYCNVNYQGTSGSSSTSGSYSVGSSKSSISFSSLPFPSMGNSAFSNLLPAFEKKDLYGLTTLPYKGSGTFHGMIEVEGIPYFVSITDPNDMDGNGLPNFLDGEMKMKSFSQVSDVGNGWLKSDWLGYYWINPSWQTSSSDLPNYVAGHANDTFHSWVFHSVFGWIYISSGKYEVFGIGNGFSAWIYFQDKGWRYTDGLLFPFLYNSKTSSWLYYNSSSSKALYDYSSSEWKSIDPL